MTIGFDCQETPACIFAHSHTSKLKINARNKDWQPGNFNHLQNVNGKHDITAAAKLQNHLLGCTLYFAGSVWGSFQK